MSKAQYKYGGQAVLEGVMMRGRRQATVVVRRPDGSFARLDLPIPERHARWQRWPLLRGFAALAEALTIGRKALDFSATVVAAEEEDRLSPWMQTLIFAVTMVIAIGVFVVLPSLVANAIGQLGAPVLLREVIEALINLALVVAYIAAIGRIPDIGRVFGYHGAEHKVINAYEAGLPLTVESVRQCSRIHPRCGTSFLLAVALIGFLIFLSVAVLPVWQRIIARIVLIPLVAAVAFEVQQLAANYYHLPWVRWLLAPTLAAQYLTTREPNDDMIETAIAALEPVLAADQVVNAQPAVMVDVVSGLADTQPTM
ncbi:DUF1385 domain-containing protein [Chloroflexus aggregans]|uniref:DUF1385 domain-containing protein n=1 Tax=Chloroflexus aggregans (strain MD-66 / DSM 9485) TaxID=326427 RepID=B8G5F4_CHLAD|nr:DUF1385 domain-containing protein [Chloroflexus aggregans]ACL25660.1 protein of unknown function DUF1385 [Chloroflexus aggregans DSM 9485]